MPKYTVHTYFCSEDPLIRNVYTYLRLQGLDRAHKAYEIEETSGSRAKREAARRRVADEKELIRLKKANSW